MRSEFQLKQILLIS